MGPEVVYGAYRVGDELWVAGGDEGLFRVSADSEVELVDGVYRDIGRGFEPNDDG